MQSSRAICISKCTVSSCASTWPIYPMTSRRDIFEEEYLPNGRGGLVPSVFLFIHCQPPPPNQPLVHPRTPHPSPNSSSTLEPSVSFIRDVLVKTKVTDSTEKIYYLRWEELTLFRTWNFNIIEISSGTILQGIPSKLFNIGGKFTGKDWTVGKNFLKLWKRIFFWHFHYDSFLG